MHVNDKFPIFHIKYVFSPHLNHSFWDNLNEWNALLLKTKDNPNEMPSRIFLDKPEQCFKMAAFT